MDPDPSHFIIGIDLGTTHTAVAYADLRQGPDAGVQVWPVPQLVAPGEVEGRPLLPSFLYLPAAAEFGEQALDLPWAPSTRRVIGEFARDHGETSPRRLVASAKSWLCHPAVDRRAPILPWDATPEVDRVSPLDASRFLLEHLRDAWNHTVARADPAARMERQEILLTVPASFDAVARELTAEAARTAGLDRVVLIEEPQAAFYAWLASEGEGWRDQVRLGDLILVCDIGGGTTDLTLVAVQQEEGAVALRRVAVGEHLLLGGDNMDLALAFALQSDIESTHRIRLQTLQVVALQHACRRAKERLLADAALDQLPVTILGTGSSVIGGTRTHPLHRARLDHVILEGFFPIVPADAPPAQEHAVGLQELGLPYAADPCVTHHLAAFLRRHANLPHSLPDLPASSAGDLVHPTAILFNGGVFNAPVLRQRVHATLQQWRADAGDATPLRMLQDREPDLAVARGAAYYGLVRHGRGIRIRAGTARSYYIAVQAAMPAVPGHRPQTKALTLVPFGTEEGTTAELCDQEFALLVGRPARFTLLASSTRRGDMPGTVLDAPEDTDAIEEIAPLQTSLAPTPHHGPGTVVPVHLACTVSETGTLELHCVDRAGTDAWRLRFDLRAEPAPADAPHA